MHIDDMLDQPPIAQCEDWTGSSIATFCGIQACDVIACGTSEECNRYIQERISLRCYCLTVDKLNVLTCVLAQAIFSNIATNVYSLLIVLL